MKRSKFGFGLLLGLLILGCLSTWLIRRNTEPVTESIRQAGDAAWRGDWVTAEKQMGEAKDQWEERYPLCASLTDHGPMEEINSLFAQLEVYGKCRDAWNFAAVCALLAEHLKAIGEAHTLNWWNVL